MGMIGNLILAWKNRDKLKLVSQEVDQVRTAYKATPTTGIVSTEFLTVALTAVVTLYNGFSTHQLDPKFATEMAAALVMGYGAFRTFLKALHTVVGIFNALVEALHGSVPTESIVPPPAQ